MLTVNQIEKEMMRLDHPDFAAGDKVKVHVKIKEGEKERVQIFEGIVISKRKGTTNATFTVRKIYRMKNHFKGANYSKFID